MIVITVLGLKKSGKTTCCEALIREFKRRGLKVGGVKSMHHARMTIDTKGKDTWRHRQAGADCVVSLSMGELAYIERKRGRATIADVMRHVPEDLDVLVCEGVEDDSPTIVRIVAVKSPDFIPETLKIRGLRDSSGIVALTGILANKTKVHPRYPVFNCTKAENVRRLADLTLAKAKQS